MVAVQIPWIEYIYLIYIYIYIYKLADPSRGWPESSFLNSYCTEI